MSKMLRRAGPGWPASSYVKPARWSAIGAHLLGALITDLQRSCSQCTVQDVILGKDLVDFVKRIASHERYLVVLSTSVTALEWQEEQRTKAGYVHLSAGALDEVLRRETSQIGYWLDCSSQTTDETVADILANLDKAAV